MTTEEDLHKELLRVRLAGGLGSGGPQALKAKEKAIQIGEAVTRAFRDCQPLPPVAGYLRGSEVALSFEVLLGIFAEMYEAQKEVLRLGRVVTHLQEVLEHLQGGEG